MWEKLNKPLLVAMIVIGIAAIVLIAVLFLWGWEFLSDATGAP
jgi:hypothetical protein